MSKETFPRIVANGEWYRIETSPKVYDRYIPFGTICLTLPIWETRFANKAIKRLVKLRSEEHHDDPGNWKPVLTSGGQTK